jgi:hypothetical protein
MTLIAMVSAKGSPGVTTTALACTLTWPVPTLLAECDPAGGDLLAGYLAKYELPANRGVLALAGAALRGNADNELPNHLIDLDSPRQQRMALPGISDPAQSASLNIAWSRLAEFFAALPHTVIADCGRLAAPHAPWPLLARADLVLLVIRRSSVRTVSPAVPAVNQLRRELPSAEAHGKLGLLLVGDGIPAREIARHIVLPVIDSIGWDPKTAAALNGEGKGRRRGPLMRSAASAFNSVRSALSAPDSPSSALARRTTEPLPVTR